MNQEKIINSLIKLIPPVPKSGILRHALYQKLVPCMGHSVYIQEDVDLIGTSRLELGNQVRILKDTCISARSPHSRIKIGNQVLIKRSVEIEADAKAQIEIGDRTLINHHVWILGVGNIWIGQDCLISPYVGIIATNREYRDVLKPINTQGNRSKGITIGNDCWLGHRVSVLDGVTIGQGSIIGAGSVVTKNIPPYSIAVGVPAKIVSSRNKNESSVTLQV